MRGGPWTQRVLNMAFTSLSLFLLWVGLRPAGGGFAETADLCEYAPFGGPWAPFFGSWALFLALGRFFWLLGAFWARLGPFFSWSWHFFTFFIDFCSSWARFGLDLGSIFGRFLAYFLDGT